MITDNVTGMAVIAAADQELSALRDALLAIKLRQQWLTGISLADLEAAPPSGLGFSAGYAQALKSAYADADGVRQYYETGTPPGSTSITTSQAPIIGA